MSPVGKFQSWDEREPGHCFSELSWSSGNPDTGSKPTGQGWVMVVLLCVKSLFNDHKPPHVLVHTVRLGAPNQESTKREASFPGLLRLCPPAVYATSWPERVSWPDLLGTGPV